MCRNLGVPRVSFWWRHVSTSGVSQVSQSDGATYPYMSMPCVVIRWCHVSSYGLATSATTSLATSHATSLWPHHQPHHLPHYVPHHHHSPMTKSSYGTLHNFYLPIWVYVGKDLSLQTFTFTCLHFLYV